MFLMNETTHRQFVSGQLKGWRGVVGRLGLGCISVGYGLAVGLRSIGYRQGWLKTAKVNVPVISVGNLTAGGTGKTPFAAFVAQWFREHETRVCFLSRGYGADPGAVNDEALVLNLVCPDVPHLQNPDRVAGAVTAILELETQLLILDDGFQHRRLARDLDIVLIDATNPWGYDALLPRGYLREPLAALRRASLIVLTRVDQIEPDERTAIHRRLKQTCPEVDVVEVSFPSRSLTNANQETTDWADLSPVTDNSTRSIAAFCGIGNPASFRQLIQSHGLNLPPHAFRVFPDHHKYTREDVESLRQWATNLNVSSIITTQKDLVKLEVAKLGTIPLWAAEITTEVQGGVLLLEKKFQAILKQIPPDEW